MDFAVEIKEHTLEFFEDEHIYLVDGLMIPSITQLMKVRFGRKYDGISKAVLNRAAEAGTALHEAIERYCTDGTESELQEFKNFKFLQKKYGFEVLENEVPVILFYSDEPIAAGRLDMVIQMPLDGEIRIGGADIKRTSALDKDYLAYQLNLYRIAYRQCYGVEWEFLRGIHLREEKRRFVEIPIVEDMAWSLIHEWRKINESGEFDRAYN